MDGFVQRYRTQPAPEPDVQADDPTGDPGDLSTGDDDGTHPVDGLPPGEGAFLLCSFWLVDNLELLGRHDDAVELFERLLDLRNDVGLLSEEWDPVDARMLGNFPQAFSHVGMINTARNLTRGPEGPAMQRADRPGRSEGGSA